MFRCACAVTAVKEARSARKAGLAPDAPARFAPSSVDCPFEIRCTQVKNSERLVVKKSVLRHTCLDHDASRK